MTHVEAERMPFDLAAARRDLDTARGPYTISPHHHAAADACLEHLAAACDEIERLLARMFALESVAIQAGAVLQNFEAGHTCDLGGLRRALEEASRHGY